jgi:hypothetical protein
VNGVATCKIQPSGVQYSIDSGPLQPVVYGDVVARGASFATHAAGSSANLTELFAVYRLTA